MPTEIAPLPYGPDSGAEKDLSRLLRVGSKANHPYVARPGARTRDDENTNRREPPGEGRGRRAVDSGKYSEVTHHALRASGRGHTEPTAYPNWHTQIIASQQPAELVVHGRELSSRTLLGTHFGGHLNPEP